MAISKSTLVPRPGASASSKEAVHPMRGPPTEKEEEGDTDAWRLQRGEVLAGCVDDMREDQENGARLERCRRGVWSSMMNSRRTSTVCAGQGRRPAVVLRLRFAALLVPAHLTRSRPAQIYRQYQYDRNNRINAPCLNSDDTVRLEVGASMSEVLCNAGLAVVTHHCGVIW
jgi:hypothetical protein